ncbi:hypothetical protein D3C77_540480 [compost metagenome]
MLITATTSEVAMAIRPTCRVTPTALRNAGNVLRMNATSKLIGVASASETGCAAWGWSRTGPRVDGRWRLGLGVPVSTLVIL